MKNLKLSALTQRVCGFLATKAFNRNFELVIADTPETRDVCHALRYQMYYVERGCTFLTVENEREFDEVDDQSLHFLLKYKPDNKYIGMGRLVLTAPNGHALPIQTYMTEAQLAPFGLSDPMQAKTVCEVSRLGIMRDYRRSGSAAYRNLQGLAARLLKKHIGDICKLGLYRGVFDFAMNHTRTPNCVFVTDAPILRNFKKAGLNYTVMAEQLHIPHPVVPVYFNIPEMITSGKDKALVSWAITTDNGRIMRGNEPVQAAPSKAGAKVIRLTPAHRVGQSRKPAVIRRTAIIRPFPAVATDATKPRP